MDNVLVVTGGSRGIGAGVAQHAAAQNWVVVFSYETDDSSEADAVVKSIEAKGGRAFAVKADSSVEADVVRLFDEAAKHGRIGALVNNAGIAGGPSRAVDIQTAELRRLIDVNVIGTFLCATEAVRRMSTAHGCHGGAIVNMGSASTWIGAPGERVHYAASKGAITAMSHGLALEVAREGIRVNCVHPGIIETALNPPERVAKIAPTIPLGRGGSVDEVATVVMFLISSEASYVLGAELRVTGGR